jgi:hypothetical protein
MLRFSMTELTLTGAALTPGGPPGPSFLPPRTQASLAGHVTLYTTTITCRHGASHITFTPQRPPAALPSHVTCTNLATGPLYLTSDTLHATWPRTTTPPATEPAATQPTPSRHPQHRRSHIPASSGGYPGMVVSRKTP